MKRDLDGGYGKPREQAPRKSARVAIGAEVQLRRSGKHNYVVQIFDLSREGCKLEFVERPSLDETVWVKVEGLEPLQASVCWVEDFSAGIEFSRPIHSAVFEMLVGRLR
jgi:hypothetical protein